MKIPFVLAVGVVAAARLFAQAQPDASATFEVASIKRNTDGHFGSGPPFLPNGEVRMVNAPVRTLILFAYPVDVNPAELIGLPSWAESERYDVVAKGKAGATAEERQQMLRALLKERTKLAAHYETRERASYDLVLARQEC